MNKVLMPAKIWKIHGKLRGNINKKRLGDQPKQQRICNTFLAFFQQMQNQRIILSRKNHINSILQGCEQYSKRYSNPNKKIELPKLTKSYTQNPQNSQLDDRHSLKEAHPFQKKKLLFIDTINLDSSPRKDEFDKKRIKPQPFCANVHVSKRNKLLLKQIINKYKRNFHPSNASRGENNKSDEPLIRTPRIIRQLRQRYNTQQNEIEMKRMVVLNQVINENNRREVRLRRQKSLSRHMSVH